MSQLQKVLMLVAIVCVSLATCCGIWAVWADTPDYAWKSFWSLAIVLAGSMAAAGIEQFFRHLNDVAVAVADKLEKKA